jgi:hypothetical protein
MTRISRLGSNDASSIKKMRTMDIITPTKGHMQRRVAHKLVKRQDPSLFNPIYREDKDFSITVGTFLVTLILLGLYQRKDFKKMKNYFVGRGDL